MTEIKTIFDHLLTNACQALTDKALRIAITTSYQKQSGKLILRIEDEGGGISDEDLKHIFDPFFTTKHDLDGTDLGLSISYNIVKPHGGGDENKTKRRSKNEKVTYLNNCMCGRSFSRNCPC